MLKYTFKKYTLPAITRTFALPGLSKVPPVLEAIGSALQSKTGGGNAATWQEIKGALNFINSTSPVVFDIGANVGEWSSSLLKALPDVRKLVMFEPQPSCWTSLEKICSDSTCLEKKAASDTSETLIFWANSESLISSVYEKNGGGANSHQISVEAVAIDEFIRESRINRVDYMKIDTEGHDLAVIKGAQRSIQAGIVQAFSFEFGRPDVASRTFFRDFWDYITDLGLRIYRLGHEGCAIHIPRYSYDLECFSGIANYVATAGRPKRCR